MTERGSRTSDYDFVLPPALIAQHPAAQRDESRLLVVHRDSGTIEHRRFRDLAGLIPAGDVLAVNTSRVIRARLLGHRESGGAAEILLLAPRADATWSALLRPGAKLKHGARIRIADNVVAIVCRGAGDSAPRVRFESPLSVAEIMDAYGHIPLPPYIDRTDTPDDRARYQTVYAREDGSVAAPTAGLHFTPAMLGDLAAGGVGRAEVVLHVGAGTFKPVDGDDPAGHEMHRERYSLSAPSTAVLNETRGRGGHIWAVGTTTLRVLETLVDDQGRFVAGEGETGIFIRPPHVVRGADRLITNFHLPRSTLLMLVSAFAGYELARHAYDIAIAREYRFFSYGDAMCVI